MHPTFYCNQLILLMDNDLIDLDNTKVMEGFQRLQESLANFQLKVAKRQRVRSNGQGVR